MQTPMQISFAIPDEYGGMRLDRALAAYLPQHSRARLQKWIGEGRVSLDRGRCRARDIVRPAQQVYIDIEPDAETEPGRGEDTAAEDIPLEVIHADAAVIIINKPAGLVAHPAAGNPAGTLQNALLHHFPELRGLPRAGLLHRLDKDTTGLLAVARTLPAHTALTRQLQARRMGREYEAVARGVMTAGGTIDAPLGRHPRDRKRMTVRQGGKAARTHYRVTRRFAAHTHIRVTLESGRTHQIRAHFAHIRHSLVGDPVYGGRGKPPATVAAALAACLRAFPRQALHAARLELEHPESGRRMRWDAPLPEDMRGLLVALAQHQ